MPNLNKVILIGNVTRDPEVRKTAKGTALGDLSLAINRVWKDEGGDKKEETTFVNVTLWGRHAEIAGQYVKKGNPVMIEGRLHLDTWDDKQTGAKRSAMKVICENIQLLGGKPSNSDGMNQDRPEHYNQERQPRQAAPREAAFNEHGEPDDIPF